MVFSMCITSLYAQNNEGICNDIERYLSVAATKEAIQKHTLFTSLDELDYFSHNNKVAAICNLARLNLYLNKRNFSKCDSLLVECKNAVLYGNKYFKAYCFRYEGLMNYFKHQEQVALNCFLQGYNLFIQQNDTLNGLQLMKNCGLIYYNSSNFVKSEEIFNKTLRLAKECSDEKQAKSCLLNLGAIYLQVNDYEKSLNLYLNLNNDYDLLINEKALVFQNMGAAYLYLNQTELAKSCLDSSLVYNTMIGDEERVVKSKISLAKIALLDANYDKVDNLLHECLNFFPDSGHWNNKIAVYYNLIDLYSSINLRDSLLKYIKLYADAKNKVRDEGNQRALLELSAKYESAQKDQEITVLNNQNRLRRFELKQQKIMVGIIAVVAIFAIIVGIVINGHRRRLVKAKNELKNSNEAKNRILSIIGHDLRGPVGGLKSLIEIYMELPILDADDIDKLLKSALESSTNTYLLLENILTWANSQRGSIEFHPQETRVYPLVRQIVNLLDQSFIDRNIRFKVEIDKELSIFIDVDMFMSVLRNLITNSIKFSPSDSTITISAKHEKGGVLFCVKDEGVGIDEHEIYKLFTKKEAYYLENSRNAKGSGLGLILCKEFVEYHGGAIWAKSSKGKGSSFCFSIPNRNAEAEEV